MTWKELNEGLSAAIPSGGWQIGEDNDGQIVVYTGLRESLIDREKLVEYTGFYSPEEMEHIP